jgi:vacuolar-type H+-ATPase subunit I/STV1
MEQTTLLNKLNKLGVAMIDCMIMQGKAAKIPEEKKQKDVINQINNIIESLEMVQDYLSENNALKNKINALMTEKMELDAIIVRQQKELDFLNNDKT